MWAATVVYLDNLRDVSNLITPGASLADVGPPLYESFLKLPSSLGKLTRQLRLITSHDFVTSISMPAEMFPIPLPKPVWLTRSASARRRARCAALRKRHAWLGLVLASLNALHYSPDSQYSISVQQVDRISDTRRRMFGPMCLSTWTGSSNLRALIQFRSPTLLNCLTCQ